jgi:hypothetical protein
VWLPPLRRSTKPAQRKDAMAQASIVFGAEDDDVAVVPLSCSIRAQTRPYITFVTYATHSAFLFWNTCESLCAIYPVRWIRDADPLEQTVHLLGSY